jgi:hypothetical protein
MSQLYSDLERAYRKIAELEAENTRLNSQLNQAILGPGDLALHRLDQAEARISELGGRTARDGRLASTLSSLRDELTCHE